jgi:hypothetical protein
MTSRTSSALNRKTGGYAFTSAFSVAPVAAAVAVFIMCTFLSGTGTETIQTIRVYNPDILYHFLPIPDAMFYYVILLLQASVTGVLMFGFTANKRSSAAYFGLPVKRSTLFISRGGAGLLLLFVPHIIHFCLRLQSNVEVFGSTPIVWNGFFIMLGTTLTLLLTVYTVTIVITLHVGTVYEAVLFALMFLYASVFTLISAQSVVSVFLHGNTWGEYYHLSPVSADKVTSFIVSYWLPIASMNFIETFGQITAWRLESSLTEMNTIVPWSLAVWALISVALAALSYRAFKRYKAEHSGALGINKALNLAVSFAASSFVFYNVIGAAGDTAYWLRFLLGTVLSLAAFVLCRFLLTLNIRGTFELKAYFPNYLSVPGVALIITLCCVTGGFGYSKAKPDANDIAAASVTYTGAPDFVPGDGETFGRVGEQDAFIRDYTGNIFTSAADIEKILSLHQKLIDGGTMSGGGDFIKMQLHFRYGLADGRIIDRFYKYVPADIVTDFLQTLDGTDFISEGAARATELAGEAFKLAEAGVMDAKYAHIIIADELMNLTGELTGAEAEELLTALQNDINRLSFEEKYYPQGKARAVVAIPRYRYDREGVLQPPELLNSELFTNLDDMVVVNQVGSVSYTMMGTVFAPDDDTQLLLGPSTNAQRFYITGGYTETLAFLEARGLIPAAPELSQVTAMRVQRYMLNPDYDTQSLYFRSYRLLDPPSTPYHTEVPAERYAELLIAARTHYYVNGGGYLLHAEKPGDGGVERVTLFIPEADAPEFLESLLKR